MNDNEQLDNILDQALSEYREAEPLAGIEDRVMQRLRLQPKTRRVTWWKWAAVAACVATLAVVIWIGMSRRTPQTGIPSGQVAVQPNVVPLQREPAAHRSDDSKLSQVAARTHWGSTSFSNDIRPASPPQCTNGCYLSNSCALNPGGAGVCRSPGSIIRRPSHATSASDAAPVIAKIEIKPLSDSDKTPGENQ